MPITKSCLKRKIIMVPAKKMPHSYTSEDGNLSTAEFYYDLLGFHFYKFHCMNNSKSYKTLVYTNFNVIQSIDHLRLSII